MISPHLPAKGTKEMAIKTPAIPAAEGIVNETWNFLTKSNVQEAVVVESIKGETNIGLNTLSRPAKMKGRQQCAMTIDYSSFVSPSNTYVSYGDLSRNSRGKMT